MPAGMSARFPSQPSSCPRMAQECSERKLFICSRFDSESSEMELKATSMGPWFRLYASRSLESPLSLATQPHVSLTSASCPYLFTKTSSSSTHAPFNFLLSDIRPIVKILFLHPVPSPQTSAPHLLHFVLLIHPQNAFQLGCCG
jgi:hypothetical protein